MALEHCAGPVCFFHLDPAAPKIFGFAELLAGLALIVVAWTIADYRFKFRIATAPIPVVRISSIIVMSVSVLALLTDLWRAEGWLVLNGGPLTPSSWQFLLAAFFLLSFFAWVWYAVISPPALTARTGKKIERQIFETISNGSPHELAIVADEVRRYAGTLAMQATNLDETYHSQFPEDRPKPSTLESIANRIYTMLADRRMCRAIVRSSPGTAVDLFYSIWTAERYCVPAAKLGVSLLEEGIADHSSILYFENLEQNSDQIGFERSFIRTLYGRYDLLCGQKNLLNVDLKKSQLWTSNEWRTYSKVVLAAYRGFIYAGTAKRATILAAPLAYLGRATPTIPGVDTSQEHVEHDSVLTLVAVMDFVERGVGLLWSVPEDCLKYHSKDPSGVPEADILDDWVNLIVIQILHVSSVRGDQWHVAKVMQVVTERTFTSHVFRRRAGRIILYRVRRRLFKTLRINGGLSGMQTANIIRFCLIAASYTASDRRYSPELTALFQGVKRWLRNNYKRLHGIAPEIARLALPEGCQFNEQYSVVLINDVSWVEGLVSQENIIRLKD